jgi:hypothetical protein
MIGSPRFAGLLMINEHFRGGNIRKSKKQSFLGNFDEGKNPQQNFLPKKCTFFTNHQITPFLS